MTNQLSSEQQIQESQYYIPYHYIPILKSNYFSQYIDWSWGMNYILGLKTVLSCLKSHKFSSLLDIGCGDGRFLREVSENFPNVTLKGVDYSEAAIQLACALNPTIDYAALDITTESLSQKFEICTLIEVIEHIPPQNLPKFLASVSNLVELNGFLILTVPHSNKPCNSKHYQHFNSSLIRKTLSPYFEITYIKPFDKRSRINRLLLKAMGFNSHSYIITHPYLNFLLFQKIARDSNNIDESECDRLLVVAQLRSS